MSDDLSSGWYEQGKWFSRYQAGTVIVALGGGLVMLAAAAFAHESASIPLLVIGTAWTAIGVAGLWTSRRTFRAVRLDGLAVTFCSPGRELTVPVADIIEVRRARGDMNRMAPLKVITSSQGTLRMSPRLNGMIEMLVQLRGANPAVRIDQL